MVDIDQQLNEQPVEQGETENEQDQIEQEIDYANQMAAQQEQELGSLAKLKNDLYERGMAFGSPSPIKWGILFSLAAINDVVDLLDLTGFGAIISWIVSLGLTAMILLIIWLTDRNLKAAQEYAEKAKDTAIEASFMSQAENIESRVKSAAEGLKKMPGLKNLNIRSTARKNPLARAFIGSAFESVPFLGTLNLITVWVFFAYLAERYACRTAKEVAGEIRS